MLNLEKNLNLFKERFFIGRIENIEEWEHKVFYICIKWLIKTPIVNANEDSRCFIKTKRKDSIQTWQEASVYNALNEYDKQETNSSLETFNQRFNIKNKNVSVINAADFGMIAYGRLKYNNDLILAEKMINYIENNINELGLINYKNNGKNKSYVDTLGMICPFLTKYGIVKNDKSYVQLAKDQFLIYSKYAIEPVYGLPFHAFLTQEKIPLGICDWARGLAWLLIGLMDSYLCLLDNKQTDKYYEDEIRKYADVLLVLQLDNGGYNWQLLNRSVQTDSSATAVFGWYLAKAAQLFNEKKYLDFAIKCRSFLMGHTCNNGIIEHCQGDTIGIGNYSRQFKKMPFAQGYALKMQIEIEKCKKII